MKILKFLVEELLLEGGAALSNTSKITQNEARDIIPAVTARIAKALGVPRSKVKVVGSAGKKPNPDDLSGDIDIAVQAKWDMVEGALQILASDGKSHRAMRGINVGSFIYEHGKKRVQVDVMPVESVKFAEWSYQASDGDLRDGLKGAHRNELFFALARHVGFDEEDRDGDGEPDYRERYFYDLSKGLMRGTQSRVGKGGKLLKNFSTVEKKVVTNDPAKVCEVLLGSGVTPEKASTFGGVLDAIRSESFPHKDLVGGVLDQAAKGIESKGLRVPPSMKD